MRRRTEINKMNMTDELFGLVEESFCYSAKLEAKSPV